MAASDRRWWVLATAGLAQLMVVLDSTVSGTDTGAASAAVNAVTQLGGSIGAALLNTVAATATAAAIGTVPGESAAVAVAVVMPRSVPVEKDEKDPPRVPR